MPLSWASGSLQVFIVFADPLHFPSSFFLSIFLLFFAGPAHVFTAFVSPRYRRVCIIVYNIYIYYFIIICII